MSKVEWGRGRKTGKPAALSRSTQLGSTSRHARSPLQSLTTLAFVQDAYPILRQLQFTHRPQSTFPPASNQTHLLNVLALLNNQVIVSESDLAVSGSTGVCVGNGLERAVEPSGEVLNVRGKTDRARG